MWGSWASGCEFRNLRHAACQWAENLSPLPKFWRPDPCQSGSALQLQAGLQYGNITGYWPVLMFGAVRVGFSGSLSTVSTFVAEVNPPSPPYSLSGVKV